jgi:hypothetical protein
MEFDEWNSMESMEWNGMDSSYSFHGIPGIPFS